MRRNDSKLLIGGGNDPCHQRASLRSVVSLLIEFESSCNTPDPNGQGKKNTQTDVLMETIQIRQDLSPISIRCP
jgi:hypothetical protein